MSRLKKTLSIFRADVSQPQELLFLPGGLKAGFPSPAADFDGTKISLDKVLVKNPDATFYAKASGNSMTGAGIDDGDILVIDRSLEPLNNKIAVCFIDGGFTVKRIRIETDCVYLMPENQDYAPLKITGENQLVIWGIVTHVVKSL